MPFFLRIEIQTINHHLHLAMRMRKDGICTRLPRRTCFGTRPNEDAVHEGRHLKSPSVAIRQP